MGGVKRRLAGKAGDVVQKTTSRARLVRTTDTAFLQSLPPINQNGTRMGAAWWWRKGNVNRIFVILIHRVDIAYSLVNASGSILYYFIDAEKFITICCFHKSNSVCVI